MLRTSYIALRTQMTHKPGLSGSDHCAHKLAESWCDKIVIRLDSEPLVPDSQKPQNPRIRDSEIPRFRGFAGSLTLREGACAQAACWFESHPILYSSYMAILEVIS